MKITKIAVLSLFAFALMGAACSKKPVTPESTEPPTLSKETQEQLEELGIPNEVVRDPEVKPSTTTPTITSSRDESNTVDAGPQTVVVNLSIKSWEFTPSTIEVKKGDTVIIHSIATDVPHGYSIEGYNVSARMATNETVTKEFVADKEGTFTIKCNVYCGSGHAGMKATLIVK